ncbi:MAG: LTA synthase family protein [Opitutaceae bacterium]
MCRWVLALAGFLLVVLSGFRWAGQGAGAAGEAPVGAAFLLGARFDARVVAAVLLPVLLLGRRRLDPFASRAARRGWLVWLALCWGGLVLLYLADYVHVRYLQQRLNASVLGFLADARISGRMLWESYPVGWMILGWGGTTALGVIVSGRLWRWAAEVRPEAVRRGQGLWIAGLAAAGVVALYGRVGQYPLRWSDAYALRGDAGARLALNPVESLLSSLSFRGTGSDLAAVRFHWPRMAAYLGLLPPAAGEPLAFARTQAPMTGGNARPPNVVLVIAESFSAYKTSLWDNPVDTTPVFRSLAKEGLLFDHCFTPHFGTARGVWALLTGIPDVSPSETASRNPAMVDQHSLLNDFAGYERLYFLGGSASWANLRGLLSHNIRGLRLHEQDSFRSPRVDVWGISDKNLFLEADAMLRRVREPFFAIIQTAANHRPYTIAEEDLGEFRRLELPPAEVRRAGFESLAELNAFRYMDFAFGKFLAAARQAPYFRDTIFVFIGDHGIGGDAGARLPRAWTEQHLTRYHVPLLFYAPGRIAPARIGSVASMVDVLPTIAGLAGVTVRNTTLGRDLLARERADGGADNVAFIMDHNDRTIGVVRGGWYGVQDFPGGRQQVVWARAGEPAPTVVPPALPAELRAWSEAFHETSRHLLLHNRKVAASPPPAAAPAL